MLFNKLYDADADMSGSENTAEVAEQPVEEEPVDDQGENDEAEPAIQQSAEENAKYAAARRKAEAESAAVDQMFAQRFGNLKNPMTGEPIKSARGYFEALQAQERMKTEQQIKAAGVDPNLLNNLIQNDPTIQAAKSVIERSNQAEAQRMLEEDYKEVMKLDPTMKSRDDIESSSTFLNCVQWCADHPGTRFSDAYKIINFDRLSGYRTEAAKQEAINSAKSKGHLSAASGSGGVDSSKEIPSGQLENWKAMFPDKTMKELRSLYNRVHKE